MKSKLAAVLCLTMAMAPPLFAQDRSAELRAFDNQTRQAVPDAKEEFLLSRCAALFKSLLVAIGPNRLTEDTTASLFGAERAFGAAAAAVRRQIRGEDNETSVKAVLNQIDALVPIYMERYAANRDARGHSWAEDPVLAADRAVCGQMLGYLN